MSTTDPLPPPSLRSILVGVDGSPGAARALEWAAARAIESEASILAVHVLTYSAEFRRDLSLETVTVLRVRLEAELRDQWAEPARRAGVRVRTALVEDESVAAGLLHAADRADADLLVLGAKGHGNFAERLLGATTYKVSHAARMPVVIVPNDWRPRVAA
jgi:nucleotide-binding universal stress UspA family protein